MPKPLGQIRSVCLLSHRPVMALRWRRENIYVSIRENSIRIAPYLYNTNKDIDRIFTVIKQSL